MPVSLGKLWIIKSVLPLTPITTSMPLPAPDHTHCLPSCYHGWTVGSPQSQCLRMCTTSCPLLPTQGQGSRNAPSLAYIHFIFLRHHYYQHTNMLLFLPPWETISTSLLLLATVPFLSSLQNSLKELHHQCHQFLFLSSPLTSTPVMLFLPLLHQNCSDQDPEWLCITSSHDQFTILMWLDFTPRNISFAWLPGPHTPLDFFLPPWLLLLFSWLIPFLPQPFCVMSQALGLGPLLLSIYIHSFVSLSIHIVITLNFIFLAQISLLNPRRVYPTAFSTSPVRCLIITSI